MMGDLWNGQESDYAPYPGFISRNSIEYNDKMVHQSKVLRGGSFATPRASMRSTHRNFFHPNER